MQKQEIRENDFRFHGPLYSGQHPSVWTTKPKQILNQTSFQIKVVFDKTERSNLVYHYSHPDVSVNTIYPQVSCNLETGSLLSALSLTVKPAILEIKV